MGVFEQKVFTMTGSPEVTQGKYSCKHISTMLMDFVKSLFSTSNERKLRSYTAQMEQINALEGQTEVLQDEELRARTGQFREQLGAGASLDSVLPQAFATVREAARRTLGQRHFDVQLIGGMVLHEGKIAEMKTGEGKTLAATLPVYLNALGGHGVHVVTVNDYLARRDAEWMGRIYSFLGLQTGVIVHDMDDAARQKAYAADVTYATNNELGFDYLRDNMKLSVDQMAQRGHAFAIVDEVDSILIDEARTPLIISGATENKMLLYRAVDRVIPQLREEDYEVDEKARTVTLTEHGAERIEALLRKAGILKADSPLYEVENTALVHHVNQGLRAHVLYTREKDYIVKDGRVVIIDEFTGRMMEGRRYSEGLHQALEAKERVSVQEENQTLASITFQNYFRLYDKLAGMTGTAMTEEGEFMEIYALDVISIPTNMAVCREDHDDEIYRTAEEKREAILETVRMCHQDGQPVLVGTASIEKSEIFSRLLKKAKIKHNVLNARYHEQEAKIIAQAGSPGAVTIATNMAGRGTDIQLGGNLDMRLREEVAPLNDQDARHKATQKIKEEIGEARRRVLEAGGLFILGTERHESRRIDNQLRGRSGRQGDPGASKFFLSLEDDLMRIFASDRLDSILGTLGMKRGEALVHPLINRALETAQKRVEAHNFDIRKNLLKYDNVINSQRQAIFEQRLSFVRGENISESVTDMRRQVLGDLIEESIPPQAYPEQWDALSLKKQVRHYFALDVPVEDWVKEEGVTEEEVRQRLVQATDGVMAARAAQFPKDAVEHIETIVLLRTLDRLWQEHLQDLEYLRQVIGLRGYGQRDPLNEFQTEAFEMFEGFLDRLRAEVTRILFHLRIQTEARPPPPLVPASEGDSPDPSSWGKVGRNAPCPCGSGRKYKHCHGR